MSLESGLFLDVVVGIAVAFIGGVAAHALRLPLVLGYLLAGMVIGPHVLGFITSVDDVRELAKFGVVLLLFAVGMEVSFRDLRKIGRPVIGVGLGQIAITVAVGYGVGAGLGWDREQSVILGLIISISSTMVVLKTLLDRGELRSLHGRILTGIMLVQDLAFVVMIAILPALGEDGRGFAGGELGLGILKAGGALTVMAVLGTRLLPPLLRRVAHLGSRELFVLTLVAVTFGAAAITQEVGLSAAVGAFLVGLALSESDFGRRAISEIVPLRDVFAALFFVTLGMLADPMLLASDPGVLFAVVGAAMVVKFAAITLLVRVFGYLPHTSLLVGLGMVQIGEFSFILADSAATMGAVDDDFLSVIILAAVITMAASAPILAVGSKLLERWSQRIRYLRPYQALERGEGDEIIPRLRGHAVIAGLGRVGALVAQTFRDRGIPVVAVELDPHLVGRWRELGCHTINGSSANEDVLKAVGVKHAKLLILATGDPASASVTAEHARRLNPLLDIVARVHWREEGDRLKRLNVTEVVWPEMEAGLEILRHSLLLYGTRPAEVSTIVEGLRERLAFGPDEDTALPEEGIGEVPGPDHRGS